MPAHAVLLLRFSRSEPFPESLRLEVVGEGKEREWLELEIEAGGLLVQDLSRFGGQKVTRIRFHGEGLMPKRLIKDAVILAPSFELQD